MNIEIVEFMAFLIPSYLCNATSFTRFMLRKKYLNRSVRNMGDYEDSKKYIRILKEELSILKSKSSAYDKIFLVLALVFVILFFVIYNTLIYNILINSTLINSIINNNFLIKAIVLFVYVRYVLKIWGWSIVWFFTSCRWMFWNNVQGVCGWMMSSFSLVDLYLRSQGICFAFKEWVYNYMIECICHLVMVMLCFSHLPWG